MLAIKIAINIDLKISCVWKDTLSQMKMYLICSASIWYSAVMMLWGLSTYLIMLAVIQGPPIVQQWRNPFCLTAAHTMMLPALSWDIQNSSIADDVSPFSSNFSVIQLSLSGVSADSVYNIFN